MDRENTIEDYKNSLIYPIFINGIRFTREQFLRTKPRWFWTADRVSAFYAGHKRVEKLFKQHSRNDSKRLDFYQKHFKSRDYINSGNISDFPTINVKINRKIPFPYFRNFD